MKSFIGGWVKHRFFSFYSGLSKGAVYGMEWCLSGDAFLIEYMYMYKYIFEVVIKGTTDFLTVFFCFGSLDLKCLKLTKVVISSVVLRWNASNVMFAWAWIHMLEWLYSLLCQHYVIYSCNNHVSNKFLFTDNKFQFNSIFTCPQKK